MSQSEQENAIKKGSLQTLKVEKLAFGGQGVARLDGLVVFVDGGALPGQTVEAIITKKRKGFLEARLRDVLVDSVNITQPWCAHFGECGGCRFQNLSYVIQLQEKRNQVIESLCHLGGFQSPMVNDTIASPQQYYYRNKMEFSFGRQRWLSLDEMAQANLAKPRDFALGLHVRQRFDKILDLDECYLQSPESVAILKYVRDFTRESRLPIYSTSDHTGFWRNLVIREGKQTGQRLINIVTSREPEKNEVVEHLSTELIRNFPETTSIVHNINERKAQVAIGNNELVLHGTGTITEKIRHRIYEISANSFFQTNTLAAELLYDQVLEYANLHGDEIIYDLYGGAGTIAIFLANRAQRVVGFEIVDSAIADAEKNCRLNAVNNCEFVQGDVRTSLDSETALAVWGQPDLVVVDPPRAGMHGDVLARVLKLDPARIVYVSCNPATFARDAHLLCVDKYVLDVVQPIDMFPMTPHIELVGLFGQH